MKKKIRVAFFGSSSFSISTLEALFDDKEFEVKSIITLPPVEKNRGHKLSNNIVYDFAIENGFNKEHIFTPKTLKKNEELLTILKNQNLDFIIIVAYGKIITKDIIDIPKYEILNLHPSSLPRYRGAAPIERAIESGDVNLDICIMKVDIGLDTGDVAVREKYVINVNKGADEIVPEISKIGANLMLETIKKCIKNEIVFIPQDNKNILYAEKIDKKELFIDLSNNNLDCRTIYNKIRAFNNCGCCYFLFEGQRIKIIKASFVEGNFNNYGFDRKTGEIILNGGKIIPILVQKEGKKVINLKDFLNGIR